MNFIRLIFLAVVIASPIFATDYYVSPSGSDSSPGSLTEPFQTIARANSAVAPGDTVILFAGIYRESIRPSFSGTSGNPITYKAYRVGNDIDRVVINGFDTIVENSGGNGAWQIHSGSVYQIQMDGSCGLGVGQNMVAIGEEPLREARWPDATQPVDFNRYTMQRAEAGGLNLGGSTETSGIFEGYYDDADLSGFADDDWVGGYIQLVAEQGWWNKSGDITDSSSSRATFDFNVFNTNREAPAEGDPYYLAGRLIALDSDYEFYYDENGLDGPADMLYVQLPGGANPAAMGLEIKNRIHGANLDDRQYVILKDLIFLGNRIETNAGSGYITVDNCTVLYGAYDAYIADGGARGAIHLKGTGNRVIDSTVRHTMGNGIMVRDNDTHVINCVVQNSWFHGINTDSAKNLTITDNTVYESGTTLISISAKVSQFNRNHVYRGGMHITDIELMNTYDSGDALETEVAWNWVHDNRAESDNARRWNGGGGIRLDSGGATNGCSNYVIHHNTIWNSGERGISVWALNEGMANEGDAQIYIYNNTTNLNNGIRANDNATGIIIQNNLHFGGLVLNNSNYSTQAIISHNLDAPISGVTNMVANDYQLVSGSPAIDAGIAIASITTNAQGAAPDVGAHEYGTDPIIPGARILDHQIDDLSYVHKVLHDGTHVMRVHGFESGRTLTDNAAIRLNGNTILTDFDRTWNFENNTFGATYAVDPSAFGSTTVSIEHALNGSSFTPASQNTITFNDPAVHTPSLTSIKAGDTLKLSGINLHGYTGYRTPIVFEHLSGTDLQQTLNPKAIPLRFDSAALIAAGKMRPDGSDLHFPVGDTGILLEYHIESGLGTDDTLVWLRYPEGIGTFKSSHNFAFYMAYGTAPPEGQAVTFSEMFPYIDLNQIVLWLRPDSAGSIVDGTKIAQWSDLSGNGHHATQDSTTAQPSITRVGDFPSAIKFDGDDYLDIGDLPNSAFSSFVVYRNPTPSSTTWQRIYSAKAPAPSILQDWEGGLAHIPDNDGSGNMTAYSQPQIHHYARNGIRSLNDMVVGGISNEGNPLAVYFTGEVYEILLFDTKLDWQVRELIKTDYLARKYYEDVFGGYLARLDTASTLDPIHVTVNDVTVTDVILNDDGSIDLILPDLGSEAAELSIEMSLPDGSTASLPDLVYYYESAYDAWRTIVFENRDGGALASGTDKSDDADQDGIFNLMEFALNDDPNNATLSKLPQITKISGDHYYIFTLGQDADVVTYTLEYSEDLQDWVSIPSHTISPDRAKGEISSVEMDTTAYPNIFVRLNVQD